MKRSLNFCAVGIHSVQDLYSQEDTPPEVIFARSICFMSACFLVLFAMQHVVVLCFHTYFDLDACLRLSDSIIHDRKLTDTSLIKDPSKNVAYSSWFFPSNFPICLKMSVVTLLVHALSQKELS